MKNADKVRDAVAGLMRTGFSGYVGKKNTPVIREKLIKAMRRVLADLLQQAPQPVDVDAASKAVKPKIAKVKLPKEIIPKKQWPDFMQEHEELKGICVGSCIYNGKWSKKNPHSAHAHSGKIGKYAGWICFRTMKDFAKKTTCWHELAHILSDDHSEEGHNKTWAGIYAKLVNGEKKWLTFDWLKNKYKFKD